MLKYTLDGSYFKKHLPKFQNKFLVKRKQREKQENKLRDWWAGQGCALRGKTSFFKMLKTVYKQGKWDRKFSSNVKMSVEKEFLKIFFFLKVVRQKYRKSVEEIDKV